MLLLLPFELREEVLDLATSPRDERDQFDYATRTSLLMCCRSLNAAVLASPRLWSYVTLCFYSRPGNEVDSARRLEDLLAHLDRSKLRPLTLTLTLVIEGDDGQNLDQHEEIASAGHRGPQIDSPPIDTRGQ